MIGQPKFVLNSCYSIYDKVFDFRSRLIYMFQFEFQDEVKTEYLRKHCANMSGIIIVIVSKVLKVGKVTDEKLSGGT